MPHFSALARRELALKTGVQYLHFIGFFFALIGLKMCTDGVLRGAADMGIFTLANLAESDLPVYYFAAILAPRFGAAFVWYAIPLGWFLNCHHLIPRNTVPTAGFLVHFKNQN